MSAILTRFSPLQRILHWLMAIMVGAMLFIGIGMVSTLSGRYWTLVQVHKPLGVAILLLVLLRVAVRLRRGAPPLPDDLPPLQKLAARGSHVALYGLMVAMPLLGWGMLSAGDEPIVLFGPVHLFPIAPARPGLFTILRDLHSWLAFALFATILMHLSAALFHALIRRDGVFESMTPWRLHSEHGSTPGK